MDGVIPGGRQGTLVPQLADRSCWNDDYEFNGFACIRIDWTEGERKVIDLAFEQLQNRMDIVESYFDQDGVSLSPDCVVELLSGTRWLLDILHIRPDDTPLDSSAATELGEVFPGALNISLRRTFVQAVEHTYFNREECEEGSSVTDCRCVLAALSGLILHETGHSCLLNEKQAYLLEYFFRISLADALGLGRNTDRYGCCGLADYHHRVRSVSSLEWDAGAYASQDEVRQFVRGPTHQAEFDADGATGNLFVPTTCADKSLT